MREEAELAQVGDAEQAWTGKRKYVVGLGARGFGERGGAPGELLLAGRGVVAACRQRERHQAERGEDSQTRNAHKPTSQNPAVLFPSPRQRRAPGRECAGGRSYSTGRADRILPFGQSRVK